MSHVFGVKPQPPLEQMWLDTLLEVLKPAVERGIRRFPEAEVRRLMTAPLNLIPYDKRALSLEAAVGRMTAKNLWLPQAGGFFILTAEGLAALGFYKPNDSSPAGP